MEINIEAKISSVTVYPDRARVTMTGRVNLDAGLHRLRVEPLPLTLEPESVRAGSRGSARARLLGVDMIRAFYEEAPAVDVRELKGEIEQLQDEQQVLADEQAILDAHAKYLDGLRQATGEYAWGLSRGRTTVEQQTLLSQFLQEQERDQRAAGRELKKQQRGLKRKLEKRQKELNQLQSKRQKQRYQALIDLEAGATGEFDLVLTYVVRNAGWQPLYDIRLVAEDGGAKLELTGIAQITQRTGQDWSDVGLTVSTARPALSQRLPDLKPWYVDVYSPPAPQPVMGRIMGTQAMDDASAGRGTRAMKAAPQIAEATPGYEAEVAVATAKESGAALTFVVEGQADIPSDGSPHKTTVNRIWLELELDYLCVPKHTNAVYRRVKATNTGPGPLLEGQASLFAGEEYIGSTRLEYVPSGDEIELLLGVEERITVERELARRDVDKARLRDVRQMRYGYKIALQNLLAEEAKIELRDHIPVARHEEIKVKLEKASPDPAERSELNLLEWRLQLPPGAKQEIRYEFQVEHPRSVKVTGLDDT